MQRLVAIIIVALVSISASAAQSTQHETLHLHQRPSGRVTSHFAFAQSVAQSQAHALDDIARGFGIDEMALSFTQGTRCDSIATKVGCRPPGVVLWAWMRNNHSLSSVDTRWSALTNALAGTFCASLNFITPENSAEPQSSFTHSSVNSCAP
ncbi:hypothetical protein HDU77_010936 [Chytriomyces hyalinus]|nr:hypothetical protein HDU77_010936 [Chytriomyces hyalinus]